MASKRIALFLCDKPPPQVIELDGDYKPIFRELLRKALPDPSAPYVVEDFDVRNLQYPEHIEEYDAIIMTGSGTFTELFCAEVDLAPVW